VVEKRHRRRAAQEHIPPDKVVFIDGTWAKTNLTRTDGRSPLGTRMLAKVPAGRWQTTTFQGAMRDEGFIPPLTVERAINGPLFLAWVEQCLAPALRPGDIVAMDNLSSHKFAEVQRSDRSRWCRTAAASSTNSRRRSASNTSDIAATATRGMKPH
jgi:hypothetical protein